MRAVKESGWHPWPEPDGPWQVRLSYALRPDRTECVGLSLKPMRDDCPALTATDLRKLSLPELVAQDAAWRLRQAATRAEQVAHDPATPSQVATNAARQLEIAGAGVTSARRGPKPKYGDDHYRAVSERYANLVRAGEPHPISTIAREKHFAPTTVASWVREARRRGFLPPTTQGRTHLPREGSE